MNEDRDPTPEELREAEALSRALEGDGSPPGIPRDALEAAGLLRRSRDAGELSSERSRAVLEKVLSATHTEPGRKGWRRWLPLAAGAALAAGFGAFLWVATFSAGDGEAALPRPDPELLRAQAQAASGSSADLLDYQVRMQAYRKSMLAAMVARYKG